MLWWPTTIGLFSLLFHRCSFANAMNHNANVFCGYRFAEGVWGPPGLDLLPYQGATPLTKTNSPSPSSYQCVPPPPRARILSSLGCALSWMLWIQMGKYWHVQKKKMVSTQLSTSSVLSSLSPLLFLGDRWILGGRYMIWTSHLGLSLL